VKVSSRVLRSAGLKQIRIFLFWQRFSTLTFATRFSVSLHFLSVMLDIIKRVFERIYNRKSDISLMMAFTDYWRKKNEFAFDDAELKEVAQMFSDSVSHIFIMVATKSDLL
jgi:hypothetical protein